ncbi:MAG: O-antigen ligase family protein [Gammaproteobacteria bacterium]
MLTATFIFGTPILLLLMFTVEWKDRFIVFPGRGFTGNPLATGALGGTIAIIAAFLSWPKFRFLNILKWTVVALGLILTVRSGSRGETWAAIMVTFACWPIAHRLHDFKAYAILGLVVALTVAATFWALDAYWPDSERWKTDDALDEARSTRLNPALQVLDYWFTTPATIFFGLGSSASYDLIGFYSHVAPVEILIEEGILGFLIYAGIVLSCTKSGLRSFFLVRDNPVQRTQLAVLCAMFIYHLLLSLKEGSFLGSSMLFMVAILLGKYHMALSHRHRPSK